MTINVSECTSQEKISVIHNKKHKINNAFMVNIEKVKEFEVIMDAKLTFELHMEYAVENAFRNLSFLFRNT